MSRLKRLHRITLILTAVMYGGSLIWFLISYGGLEDEIGIHFDPKGFDVFASKRFGFYPFVAGTILTILLQLCRSLSDKLKESPKLNKTGNDKFRNLVKIYADIFTLMIAVFFTSWNWAVINQNAYYHCNYFYNGLLTFMPLMVFALPVVDVVYKHKYKNPEYKRRRKNESTN